jgi:putative restriction endonuclease
MSYSLTLKDGTILGNVPGHTAGTFYRDRKQMHDLGLHRKTMHGIASHGSSIVLSGGYEDDEDLGNLIIYTGEGGRDRATGRQIADQKLTGGNLALASNHRSGVPVRVFRGEQHLSRLPPGYRYRYDGLYTITSYWSQMGRHGYKVWRFRLEKSDEDVNYSQEVQNSAVAPRPAPAGVEAPLRREGRVTRVIRSTVVADHVKGLYAFECQFCRARLITPSGPYAESCHIKPLARPHSGPDIPDNVLCLCPNCHVLLDEGAIWISDDLRVMPANFPLNVHSSHQISADSIRHHRSMFGK